MSSRTTIRKDYDNIQTAFSSKIAAAINLVSPQNLYLILGRGTGKTSDIVAERSMNVIHDMPGSYQMFVSTTYVDALTNVVPALIEGWERKGWRKGIHFVHDLPPPKHFKLPYKPPLKYKHTISTFNGAFFNIGSLDQPSGLAGNSYQHMYGDEVRMMKKQKLDRLTPALRGDFVKFGHSVYYMGKTFTTDMPNVLLNDHDWILNLKEQMDQEQIEQCLQAGLVLNEIKKEILANEQIGNISERIRLEKSLQKWLGLWHSIRKNSSFFYAASSLMNLDILTENYFVNTLAALGQEEFKTAILSLPVKLEKGLQFYYALSEEHFFEDGIFEGYYDKYSLYDTIQETSDSLRYCSPTQPIEAGMDFGNMCSLITGQTRGNKLYCLKEFYTLPPNSEWELGRQFLEFYKNHKYKYLDFYYDRSGNQNAKIKKDRASDFKNAVEMQNGVPTGWTVNMISLEQGTIEQEQEYNHVNGMLNERYKDLPVIKIDPYRCPNMKSSLERARTIVNIDKTGSKKIGKDKRNEKTLPESSLPSYSTNFSDAFKYFVCRREWLQISSSSKGYVGYDVTTF